MKIIKALYLIIFISGITISTFAQEEHELEEFKNFRIELALGHGYISHAESNSTDFLIIPTVGFDIQYWFNHKWGLTIKNDLEIAHYLVENESGEIIIRENPFIITIPLLFSPWENGWTFFAGPGIEIEKEENFSIIRLGVGYEIELGNSWDFEPEFIYDLKNEHLNSFTIAIGVGKRF